MEQKEKRITLISKALVTNSNQQILMVRRYRPHQENAHDKWELAGGKVEFGEHPSITAERECEEESGYKVKAKELINDIQSHVWEHEDRSSNVVVMCYKCDLVGGEASTEDKGVSEVKWFNPKELPTKEECLPNTLEFIHKYFGD